MRRLLLAAGVVWAVAAAGASELPAAAARLRIYLDEYEPQLSALVAEERFEQVIRMAPRGVAISRSVLERRVLISDIGFVRLPGADTAWLAHRRVQRVDGRVVPDGQADLGQLLTGRTEDRSAAAARIATENARHNLGYPRTVNVPTLPLHLLHARNAAAYTVALENVRREDGRQVARLLFRERGSGRLVAHEAGSFVRTEVEAWVDAANGTLRRARVTLVPPRAAYQDHVVDVVFGSHPQLGLHVPTEMKETLWYRGNFEGTATYSQYRRFDTAARIVPGRD